MSARIPSAARPEGALNLVALLADGAPPTAEAPLELLRTADRLVCCDGACRTARALGREPDFVVGDGDSLEADAQHALGARFVRVADQDTNDLEKAFAFVCRRYAPARVAILGATGRREDHALGNIFRLVEFARRVPATTLYTDTGRFDVVLREGRFACRPGEAVSVFAPEPATRVTSEGLVWPLAGVDLAPLWRGTLNRTAATSFALSTSRPIIVFRAQG